MVTPECVCTFLRSKNQFAQNAHNRGVGSTRSQAEQCGYAKRNSENCDSQTSARRAISGMTIVGLITHGKAPGFCHAVLAGHFDMSLLRVSAICLPAMMLDRHMF
jgi:hypothetical protein